MIEQLNNWEYCNPSNQEDPLPQPYKYILYLSRFINKVLQKEVLNEVYSKIFEIEKYRSDPNYEGSLRIMPPQGIFDINMVTTLSSNSFSSLAVAGDAMGNIMMLDLSKKTRICRKELGQKRVLKVCLGQRDGSSDDFRTVLTIAAISHLDPIVYILRYRPGENKIFQHHTIQITKNTNNIAELPINIELSEYCQYLTVTQYNGSILIYKLPDCIQPPQQPPQAQAGAAKLPPPGPSSKSIIKPPEQPAAIIPTPIVSIDIPSTEIHDAFYKIPFKGVPKQLKYDEIINKMKDQQQPKEVEIKEDPKSKKPAPPAANKKTDIPIVAPVEDIFEQNANNTQLQIQLQDGVDQSADYPPQRFMPYVQYYTEKVSQQTGQKAFNQFKHLNVVLGVVVGWTNTTRVEIHQFASSNKNSLPSYLQSVLPPIGKAYEPQITEVTLLYPMSCLMVSTSACFLAVGLTQGSIYVHDLVLQQERFHLDKHLTTVNSMHFCTDWRLVSSSFDGSVHIYDLREGKVLCKRTNQFRKGTMVNYDDQKSGQWRVIALAVSQTGIALALDAQNEVRLYDVWRGEKIAKLSPQQVMDDKLRQWTSNKPIVQCYRNEILIQSDVMQQSVTSVQIFKIFDNLINLFPALSNVYRKGLEKDKVMNLYERIGQNDLANPHFEVPNLTMGIQNASKLQVPDQKSQQQSNQRQSKLQQSIVSKKADVSTNKGGSLVNSLHKSVVSEQVVDFNSSFRSQHTQQGTKGVRATKANVLTKEILHPEQFLLEKEVVPIPALVREDQWMVEHCRIRNQEKLVRVDKVNSMIAKLGTNLAQEEEHRIKKDLHKKLSKVK